MYQTEVKVKKDIFSAEVVLKSAYAFLETDYIHIAEDESHWIVQMSAKPGTETQNRTEEFENELLSQAVRLLVFKRTKSIREMLIARAVTSTMVDHDDPIAKIQSEQEDISNDELDEILTDWFERSEKDEQP